MARRVTVTFDDGTSHVYENAPDDATPDEVSQRAFNDFGKKVTALDGGRGTPEPKAGFLESTARDLLSGFGNAAATVARGGATVAKAFLPEGNSLPQTLEDAANSAQDYWTSVGNKSTNNDWGKAALRGVGGAMTSTPTAVSAVAGAGAGIGDEVGRKLDPNNPLLRAGLSAVGGVVAGGGAALASRSRPQETNVASELMGTLNEADLQAAQNYKNALAAKGVDIDLAQALTATSGKAGDLTTIRDLLAGRKQGRGVAGILDNQPEQLAREADLTVGNLPGTNWSPTQNANNVQETATQALQNAKNQRSATVRTLYEQAGDLPPEARSRLGAIINQYATQPGTTEVMKQRAQEFAAKLLGKDSSLDDAVASAREALANAKSPSERMAAQQQLAQANQALSGAGSGPLKAVDVDTWINELRGPWQGQPLKVAYPKEQGQIKGLAGALNKELQAMSPQLATAEGVFQRITRDAIDPLKQGPIGQLSQPRGYSPDTQAMVSKFDGLLNKGTDPTAKVSDIRTAAQELNKVDPNAFADAFKGWLSRKVQGAIEPGGVGATLPQADPAKLAQNLFSDPLQWQGIKDATSEMAKQMGVPPADMVRGLENLRQMTAAMKNTPSKVEGISAADLTQLGGTSATANLVRLGGFMPHGKIAAAIERETFGKTLSKLDTILTSPEGAKMLIELGRVPVMSRKAQMILGTWGGNMGNPGGLTSDNTPE